MRGAPALPGDPTGPACGETGRRGGRCQAQPAALAIAAQKDPGDGDAAESGVGEQERAPRAGALSGRRDHVVQMDAERGQQGVRASGRALIHGALRHARSWFTDRPSMI
ncbi:hypothetical protein GCM10027440_50900 [Nocardiopsis coralliicola]